jgi:hypothetical protein
VRDIGLWVGAASALYVLSWIPIAWLDGTLTPGQMLKKYPEFDQVIPLMVDCYIVVDLCILSPLLGFIVQQVAER